jgi:tetratricopeptide (TPR) repeat protein
MWTSAPDRALVASWIDSAVDLTEPGSAGRVKALCARVYWADTPDAEGAQEAAATADELGDVELRAAAYFARSIVAHHAGRFEEALEWVQRPLDFIGDVRDPERIVEIYESTVPAYAVLGRVDEAREMSELHEAATQPLSPHHRLHGVAVRAELEELAGAWEVLREMTPRVEAIIEENLETPCVRNQRTLLICAVAARILGDVAESERLRDQGESMAMSGYDIVLSGPRLRLALLTDDVDALERLVTVLDDARGRKHPYWAHLTATEARLGALVRLGDRSRVEAAAAPFVDQGRTYLEPFALQALGQVRGDRSLIGEALARFEDMRLSWHAEQTRQLLTA